jgi:hypothetical protein
LTRFQAFFFWNAFMKGVLTLTPLPKEDDRTDRHLKYYIWWVPVTFGHCEVPRFL